MRTRAALLFLLVSVYCKAQQPVIGAVTNAADYSRQLSAGGLATIFGTGMGTSTAQASTIPLLTDLGDISITIGLYSCPLLYVSPTQINFQIPAELASGPQQLTLNAAGQQVEVQIMLDDAGPAIFQYGTNQALAVNYSTGDLNGPSAPIQPGDYLIVYMSGIGPVSPEPADGAAPTGVDSATDSYSATIGSVSTPISFLGLAPGYVGLAQANIQIPLVPGLPPGTYPLSITVDGFVSTSALVTVGGTGSPQPSILTFVSSVGLPTGSLQTNVEGSTVVQANGQYAYVCAADQITAVDVSNPLAPVAVAAFGASQLQGQGANCIVSNNYLVDIIDGQSFVVYDLLTSPTNPNLVAGPTTLQLFPVGPIAFDGSTLLLDTSEVTYSTYTGDILSEAGMLAAYDFANFTSPVFESTYVPSSGFTSNNAPRSQIGLINSQYAAVAGTTNTGGTPTSGEGVIDVLDVSNPTNIVGVVEVPVPQAVVLQAIAVQGTEALVTGNTQSFTNPITFDVNGIPQFASMGNLTLSLVDFNNPRSPNVVSTLLPNVGLASGPYLVSLGSGYFAISHVRSFADIGGAGTLAVVDATNPASLNWIPEATLYGFGMAVQNGYLLLATSGGLSIYQVTLPN